jgi:hypothetical protein
MNLVLSSGGDFIILVLAAVLGFYMAANIGANDLANAMGTSVGSGALTMRGAVIASVIFNLSGAVLAGGHVTNTIRKGMIDPSLLAGSPEKLLLGMFAALLAAGIWVQLATRFALPVSTTHSIVGAVVGFGVLAVGFYAVSWGKVDRHRFELGHFTFCRRRLRRHSFTSSFRGRFSTPDLPTQPPDFTHRGCCPWCFWLLCCLPLSEVSEP